MRCSNENQFDGDENAILDFKYSTSPKITWWFDHHQSAFLTPEDAAHYEQDRSTKKFYDPDYRSCTKFIAHTTRSVLGSIRPQSRTWSTGPTLSTVHSTTSASTAVEMKEPAMKLTMVIESTQDPTFIPRLIPLLSSEPLADILHEPFVAELLPPLLERHKKSIEIIRQHSEAKDGTVYFDVTGYDLEGYNKFIPYYLHPEVTYSVGLSRSSFRTKVSVGSNPWAPAEPTVNLAKVCERYGGGGHARVGAISFEPNHFDEARAAAKEIVAELRAAGS